MNLFPVCGLFFLACLVSANEKLLGDDILRLFSKKTEDPASPEDSKDSKNVLSLDLKAKSDHIDIVDMEEIDGDRSVIVIPHVSNQGSFDLKEFVRGLKIPGIPKNERERAESLTDDKEDGDLSIIILSTGGFDGDKLNLKQFTPNNQKGTRGPLGDALLDFLFDFELGEGFVLGDVLEEFGTLGDLSPSSGTGALLGSGGSLATPIFGSLASYLETFQISETNTLGDVFNVFNDPSDSVQSALPGTFGNFMGYLANFPVSETNTLGDFIGAFNSPALDATPFTGGSKISNPVVERPSLLSGLFGLGKRRGNRPNKKGTSNRRNQWLQLLGANKQTKNTGALGGIPSNVMSVLGDREKIRAVLGLDRGSSQTRPGNKESLLSSLFSGQSLLGGSKRKQTTGINTLPVGDREGSCPPFLRQCPSVPEPIPIQCIYDSDCQERQKCCPDICAQGKVCKRI